MKRYITICLLWACFAALWGQTNGNYGGSYDPVNPGNPSEPSLTMKFDFKATTTRGGNVSYSPSGTEFVSGTYISLNANPETGYKFVHWMIDDTVVSTSQWYGLTMPAKDVEVKAVFVYDPALPDNPDVVPLTYKVTGEASPSHGGSVSNVNREVHVGEYTYVSASPSNGYQFKGWMYDGKIVSTDTYYYFEMQGKDMHFTALFEYEPTLPGNPSNNPGFVGTYTVTYMVDGALYQTDQVPAGATLAATNEPVKRGYTFSGWKNMPSVMPAKNLTIEGSFIINKYKIEYVVEGNTVHSAEVDFNTVLTAPEVNEKEGHTLKWENMPERMPDEDWVVTGNFYPNKYTLQYLVDGKVYSTTEILYATAITPEAEPVKVGHTFSGWSEIPLNMPAKDVTIEGSFTVNRYEIAYEIEGEVYRRDTLAYGSPIVKAEAPLREGYSFSGWGGVPATMPAKNLVLSGNYTINQYTLTYEVDGVEYKKVTLDYGTAIEAEAELTKEGYTFSGWSEIPATMPAKDVTIVGTFSANKYNVIYVLDGETFKTEQVAYGTAIVLVNAPAKEGYTFVGWSEVPSTMPAKDVTVTGSYTINQYTLTYMVDGVEYKKVTLDYGTAIEAEAEPTKEGYTFSGWSEIPATMPAKNVNVIGEFTVNYYQVTYLLDGEVFKIEQIAYGSKVPTIEVPAKPGYNFSGWGDVPVTMPAKDITLNGSYTINKDNKYNVIYLIDGVEYKRVQYAYLDAVVVEAEPTKEGYTFSGWSEVPATMPLHDVTVVGEFTVNTYTLTYIVDGEVYATEDVTYGSTIILKDAPIKEGYIFSGWSEVPETMPAKDVTVTGSFEVDGINAIISNGLVDVYTLQGVMVKRQIPMEELSNELSSGIYIVNGKKMMIK